MYLRACQSLKFLLTGAAFSTGVNLGKDGVKIDFRNSIGKIFKKSKHKIKVHAAAVVHAIDKVIRKYILAPQSTLEEGDPRVEKKPYH